MKIKILHITSSLNIGGAETVLFNLVRSLNTDLFEQEVIYFHEGPFVEQLRALNIPVHQVRGIISLYDPVFWVRLARLIAKIRPSCIHSLLWSANFCSKILGSFYRIPVVTALHNMHDHQGAVRNLLDRMTAPLWKHAIAVSPHVAQSYTCASSRTSITVIPNGIELPVLPRVVEIPDHLKNKFIVGAVGRFVPVKRFDLLIKSFARARLAMPDSYVLLVGYGPQESFLRKIIKELQLEEFVGLVQGSSLAYYPFMHCFVQTSESEGLSLALLEAMAHQVPCVVTHQAGNHPVIIDGHNGICIETADEVAIARALKRLYEDQQLRFNLGKYARQAVESSHSINTMAAKYEQVFLNLAQQSSACVK